MVLKSVSLFLGVLLVGLSSACADSVKEQKNTKIETPAKEVSNGKAIAKTPDYRYSSKAQSTTTSKTVNVPKKERVIQFIPPRVVQYDDEYPPTVQEITDSDWSSKTQSGTDDYYGVVEPEMLPEIRVEENILDFVDEQAQFPGGMTAMREYLKKNLMYPEIARDAEIQGKCYIRFIVNTDGSISDVRVLRGVADCPECDKEAMRVVKSMPKWAPGKVNGKAVRMNYNLPIVFKLS
jgi:periplasmic protein TonB